jgi:hypothetical protein
MDSNRADPASESLAIGRLSHSDEIACPIVSVHLLKMLRVRILLPDSRFRGDA